MFTIRYTESRDLDMHGFDTFIEIQQQFYIRNTTTILHEETKPIMTR